MSSRKITTLKRLAGLEGNSKVQADACWRLAGAYQSGIGVAKDAKEEMRWLMRASELGHAEAQFNLGCCYNNGQGVVQSYEKAFECFEKAADQGDTEAQFNLGLCYDNGQGVAQSFKKAVHWYKKAADQGNIEALYNLAECYKDGQGVTKSMKRATRFYKLAAKQGDAAAHAALAQLHVESGQDADMQKAQKYIRKARAALAADSSESAAENKRFVQTVYQEAKLAFLLRCGNEGCSVAYSEDVSVQSAKLKSCARCRKAAYCSLECQREDWKARHKEECGKRLEVGESFLLCKWSSRPELNGCRVEVEVGMDEATRAVGVRVVSEAFRAVTAAAAEEEEGEGKEEEDGEERKADAAEGCNVGRSAVGLAMSVKPMNLKKEQ